MLRDYSRLFVEKTLAKDWISDPGAEHLRALPQERAGLRGAQQVIGGGQGRGKHHIDKGYEKHRGTSTQNESAKSIPKANSVVGLDPHNAFDETAQDEPPRQVDEGEAEQKADLGTEAKGGCPWQQDLPHLPQQNKPPQKGEEGR